MIYIYRAISILIAMVLHEWAHGYVSYKLGDPTPKTDGRLSLNPLKHIDPVGAIMLLICGFGWAKPVEVNYNYYKDAKKGMALTAIAGPMMNFVIAIISIILFKHILPITFLTVLATINISLGVFNLIPIPPLDGSKVMAMFLPNDIYNKYMQVERFGFYILLAIMALGVGSSVLNTLIETVCMFFFNVL